MQSPNIWDDPKVAEALGREKSNLEKVVGVIERLSIELEETRELLELVSTEDDDEVVALIKSELASNEELISQLEFRRNHYPIWQKKNYLRKAPLYRRLCRS